MKDAFQYDIICWEKFFKDLQTEKIKQTNVKESMALDSEAPVKGIDQEGLESQLILDFEQDLLTRFEIKEMPGNDELGSRDKQTKEHAGGFFFVLYCVLWCVYWGYIGFLLGVYWVNIRYIGYIGCIYVYLFFLPNDPINSIMFFCTTTVLYYT